MLEVSGIVKTFGAVRALDGVSLSLGPGQIVGFLGPNGAGKSTTMRAIMGLIAVDSGTMTWNGAPIDSDTRHRFGYMPAERGMYPKMTVRDQLVYFARLAGNARAAAERAAETWMERLGVAARAGESGGGRDHEAHPRRADRRGALGPLQQPPARPRRRRQPRCGHRVEGQGRAAG
ncbi:MAG: ATP-binding cassette domain-containing protein [Actinobacteria bacterium]|nr:ATP-binding cassette domain-containing protein [Actinomycetota bacterium]